MVSIVTSQPVFTKVEWWAIFKEHKQSVLIKGPDTALFVYQGARLYSLYWVGKVAEYWLNNHTKEGRHRKMKLAYTGKRYEVHAPGWGKR